MRQKCWLLWKAGSSYVVQMWKRRIAQVVLFAALSNLSILITQPTFDLSTATAVPSLLCWSLFFLSFFLSSSSSSSSSSSAAQPHSHSSSLSSVELFSASDDVHRFSAQVLYCSRRQEPVSTEACTQPLQGGGGGVQIAWECPLTSLCLSRISKGFPVPPLEPVDYSSKSWYQYLE